MTVEKVISPEIENIVDVIGDIVSEVQAEYDTENSEKPYYLHGHPQEIINTIIERNAVEDLKFKKYPCIVLFEDFISGSQQGIFKSTAKLNIVIMTDSSKDYKAEQRYDNSFDVILTPIYDLFIKQIARCRRIHKRAGRVDHQKINHLYWGKKDLGNFGVDFIDAIEIKDLDIKVYR